MKKTFSNLSMFLLLSFGFQGMSMASQWEPLSTNGAPELSATGIWTRDSMGWPGAVMSGIVNGKLAVLGTRSNTGRKFSGGIYDFANNTWAQLPEQTVAGFDENLFNVSYLSQGNSFYVWGGCSSQYCNTRSKLGWRIDPLTNTWKALPLLNAPSARQGHQLIAIDEKLLVWFGRGANAWDVSADIGLYDPKTNSWSSINLEGGPTPRLGAATWYANGKLYVLGGRDGYGRMLADGFKYDFVAKTWSPLKIEGIKPRFDSLVTTMGNKTLVWGGKTMVGDHVYDYLTDGAVFNNETETWSALSRSDTASGPTKREVARAVWTGSKVIIWGGLNCHTTGSGSTCDFLNDGYAFTPATGSWEALPSYDKAVAATVNWSGNELVLWGGLTGNWSSTNQGAKLKLTSSVESSDKGNSISNPQLIFDSEKLTKLESCILDDLKSQSPDMLVSVLPGGSPTYVNGTKSVVEIRLAGTKGDGNRVGYKVRFKTVNQSDWLYFQDGQSIGVYAANMETTAEAFSFKTGERMFTANLANCSQ